MRHQLLPAFFNCPFVMHELVADADISKAIFALKDVQKELLYQLSIQGHYCQTSAAFREQTDRNIRKIRDTMLKKPRKLLNNGGHFLCPFLMAQLWGDKLQMIVDFLSMIDKVKCSNKGRIPYEQ